MWRTLNFKAHISVFMPQRATLLGKIFLNLHVGCSGQQMIDKNAQFQEKKIFFVISWQPCDQSVCPANQHLKSTIKKKKPIYLCTPRQFIPQKCLPHLTIIQSCYFDYRINKAFTCSCCVICISCSVHLILMCYTRKVMSQEGARRKLCDSHALDFHFHDKIY